jgi:hypothetical protein
MKEKHIWILIFLDYKFCNSIFFQEEQIFPPQKPVLFSFKKRKKKKKALDGSITT